MPNIKHLLLLLAFISSLHANIPPQITYNENHKPLVIEYEDGNVVEFDYNQRGRLKTQTTSTSSVTATISYSYDGVGKIGVR